MVRSDDTRRACNTDVSRNEVVMMVSTIVCYGTSREVKLYYLFQTYCIAEFLNYSTVGIELHVEEGLNGLIGSDTTYAKCDLPVNLHHHYKFCFSGVIAFGRMMHDLVHDLTPETSNLPI
jgi:hypothetical protein